MIYYSNSFNVCSINHSASSEIILMDGFVGGYTLLVFVRICIFSGSIAIHSHMYFDPTLSNVSSTMNSVILLLFDLKLFGMYF